MRTLAVVLVVLLAACERGPADPDPSDVGPPVVWPVQVEISNQQFLGDFVTATTELPATETTTVRLQVSCGVSLSEAGVRDAVRAVRPYDDRRPFPELQNVTYVGAWPAVSFEPGGQGEFFFWGPGFLGGSAQLHRSEADWFVSRAADSSSLRATYFVSGALRSYAWDTRGLRVALDELRTHCGWPT